MGGGGPTHLTQQFADSHRIGCPLGSVELARAIADHLPTMLIAGLDRRWLFYVQAFNREPLMGAARRGWGSTEAARSGKLTL